MTDTIVYDVEIANEVDTVPGKWSNPEGMGLSSAVCYSYEEDRYHFFLAKEGAPATTLNNLLRFLEGKLVVGFNSIRFDSRVLLGNRRIFTFDTRWTCSEAGMWGWKNYDIMFEYVYQKVLPPTEAKIFSWLDDPKNHVKGVFSLNGLAGGTFGSQKSGSGAHAPILYQQGEYDQLLEYNLQDVRLTKKLYDFIQTYGYVIDGNGMKQIMRKEV